ncbi:hypothetical protein WJX77_009495 [Trebouxia sp. C0004]
MSLQVQNPDSCGRRVFWFTAITSRSSLEYWRYAKVAVLSAKEHSPNLIPVLLYGGSSGVPSLTGEANIHWYREQGGIVYHHNLTFMSDLQAVAEAGLRGADWPEEVEGTYLRMDVPHIVPHLLSWLEQQKPGVTNHINKDVALYTDADVMFYHEVNPCKLDLPEIMAIGPEMDRVANSWSELNWNAGVLLMNLRGFAAVLPKMLQWANRLHWNFEVADQSMINDYFPAVHGRPLDILPDPYNWKAYWGCSPSIVIVHWHGPKPERCLKCYIALWEQSKENEDAIKFCKCDRGYDYLWSMAMEADSAGLYRKAVRDYTTYAKIINGTGNIMDSDAMLGAF